ncbi:hypothetical protein [Deefgea sp. CFH1-16]|uniref:hypothetical protein n=1 Tax=Deefgea sp. CFH1-16 TaxID=2675457 RepID=UPI0024953F3D|nr:hypothetical protein [Deefgea sp. CFH1-16]
MSAPIQFIQSYLNDCGSAITAIRPWQPRGRLTRVSGMVLEAVGLRLPIGASCQVMTPNGHSVEAVVVGFQESRLFLMPIAEVYGVEPGAAVIPLEDFSAWEPEFGKPRAAQRRVEDHGRQVPVGWGLLNRILDGLGRPLDGKGPLQFDSYQPLFARPYNPMDREPVKQVMDVGVRAINAMLTVGRGQRLGLFAGSGVGKSVLLGMMARYTKADVVVVGA